MEKEDNQQEGGAKAEKHPNYAWIAKAKTTFEAAFHFKKTSRVLAFGGAKTISACSLTVDKMTII